MSTYSDLPSGQSGSAPEPGRPAASRGSSAPKRRRRRRRNPALVFFSWFFKILGTLLLIGIVTGCFVACYGAIYIRTVIMPKADRLDLSAFALNEPSTIYYTDKTTGLPVAYATLVGDENRIILDRDEIPEVFKMVTTAIEDKRFYKHRGVDWIRTGAAVLHMFTGRSIQGGSTITQQVIKNYTQEDEVTVKRKVLEIFEALSTENKYSKDDILTMYLNYIYLGHKQYGIAAAARFYFDKDVSEITLPEAASIIAITNNPSLYSPYSTVETTNSKGEIETGLERNKRRQELILNVMCYEEDIAMISEEEYKAAVAAPLNFTRGQNSSPSGSGEVNSWYTDQVIQEVVDYYVSQGYTEKAAYGILYSGGLHIYTPFDPDVQACVDEVYTDYSNLNDPNTGKPYTSRDGQQLQSCITVVDNSTGYVVAMAGAMGDKTGNLWWNYATDSARQPGSSIKPLAVYSPAIEMGLITPYSIVDDFPYQILNDRLWPVNADGYYAGLSTVSSAVARSTNTIAVKILNDYVTPELSYRFLEERYGITTLYDHKEINGQIYDDHNAAQLALGGLSWGLSPYEVTAAYATFPRGGAFTRATVVHRVENRDHQIIWDNTPKSTYPIKESTAHYMNQMLQGVVTSGTGTGARIDGMHVAGKTGTTTNEYDLWFAGYTPYYTAAVWTGYPLKNAKVPSWPSPAASLWRKVMTGLHEGLEDREFFSVSDVRSYNICLDCGLRATDACSNDIRGNRVRSYSFVEGTQPSGYCTCHVPVEICVHENPPAEDGKAVKPSYYLPGEYCPEESVRSICAVNYVRDPELSSKTRTSDASYMLNYFAGLPVCPFHTEETQEPDPDDEPSPPATEPPATEPPATEPPVTEPPVTEPPVTEPPTEPPVTEPPDPEPGGEPDSGDEPPEDDFVPVW